MLEKGFAKIDEEKGPRQLSNILGAHVMHENVINVSSSSPQNQKRNSLLKQPS